MKDGTKILVLTSFLIVPKVSQILGCLVFGFLYTGLLLKKRVLEPLHYYLEVLLSTGIETASGANGLHVLFIKKRL